MGIEYFLIETSRFFEMFCIEIKLTFWKVLYEVDRSQNKIVVNVKVDIRQRELRL